MSQITRALVTGSSAGIGEALARQLSQRGVAVTLVARREDRLRDLADRLPGEAEVLAADLTVPADLERVAQRLLAVESPVDLLVNNAGYGDYGPFDGIAWDRLAGEVDLNVKALVRLTHAIVPRLRALGGGGVINVSSTAGFQPGPYGAVYGATKSFVTSFTRALAIEMRGTGVRVLNACPGVTETEFQAVADVDVSGMPRFGVQTAEEVAEEILDAFARGRSMVVTGAANKVMTLGSRIGPSALAARVSGSIQKSWMGRG